MLHTGLYVAAQPTLRLSVLFFHAAFSKKFLTTKTSMLRSERFVNDGVIL